VGGNINLMGIVDFAEIRPSCTEVALAVHYEIRNKLLPGSTGVRFVDTFVTAELRSIRARRNRASYLSVRRFADVQAAAANKIV
jgi:hypothetical protein